jgi:hypothetical protein
VIRGFAQWVLVAGSVTSALAQGARPPIHTELTAQLDARSSKLFRQYQHTGGLLWESCPRAGRTWSDLVAPPHVEKDNFLRELKVVCETAQASLAEYPRIVKSPTFRPELFAFTAYRRDLSAVNHEYYVRQLFGPFLIKAECERHEQLFRSVGIGTLSCGVWAYE